MQVRHKTQFTEISINGIFLTCFLPSFDSFALVCKDDKMEEKLSMLMLTKVICIIDIV